MRQYAYPVMQFDRKEAMNAKQQAREDAIRELREVVNPGDTLKTIVRHVSRSGMTRHIDVYNEDASLYLTNWAADALDYRQVDGKFGALKVGGCGMDMGFHVVYSLSRTLFPDGFTCTGEDCPSNDHSNGDRDYTPHHHSDGGYALKQRWL